MHNTRFSGRLLMTLVSLAAASVFGFSLAGCNTTEGAGEDIEAAGEAIDDAAEDAND